MSGLSKLIMTEVNDFLERQKQSKKEEEELKAIKAIKEAEYARSMRKEFVETMLPEIAALDAQGVKRYKIGRFSKLPRVWCDIATEHGLGIRTGGVTYMTYPSRSDYYLTWK